MQANNRQMLGTPKKNEKYAINAEDTTRKPKIVILALAFVSKITGLGHGLNALSFSLLQ